VAETGERAAVWRLRDGQRLSQVDHPPDHDALSNDDLLSVLLSRDATVLVTANRSLALPNRPASAGLLAWRPHDGALLQRFPESSYASRLAFDERGALMAWPRRGPEGKLSNPDSWAVDSGRRVPAGRPLVSSENLARSADGRRVAERQGRDVLVLDSANPQRPSLLADEADANDIAVSPDGRHVASAGGDGVARLFEAGTDDLLADACRRLPRNLSGEQWARYVGALPWHPTCPGLPGAAPVASAASAASAARR
jgi:WD40 repeat protein